MASRALGTAFQVFGTAATHTWRVFAEAGVGPRTNARAGSASTASPRVYRRRPRRVGRTDRMLRLPDGDPGLHPGVEDAEVVELGARGRRDVELDRGLAEEQERVAAALVGAERVDREVRRLVRGRRAVVDQRDRLRVRVLA